jgi:transcription elongation factor Elf1
MIVAEVKRRVVPFEVNYVCDSCNNGMMEKTGEMNKSTGEIEHKCLICGAEHTFKWVSYPRIDYVGEEDL